MWHTFIEFGGLLFWGLLAVWVIILSVQVNDRHNGYATLTLFLGLAILVLFSNTPIWQTIKDHPIYVLYGVLGYIVAAGVWAMIQWRFFFLPKLFDKYDDYRASWLKRNSLTTMPADPTTRSKFKDDMARNMGDINDLRSVSQNKGRITGWMVYWPFSIVGTFFGDFLHRLFASIYKLLAGSMQRISDNRASKYEELN
jgi:hypothetical protein